MPALKNDIVAQGVVKDPFLLIHWLSPPNIRETLKKHPALFDAAQQLLAIMHTEASKPPPPGHPLLFPALPDEDESDEENGAARNRTANRQNVARPSGLAARPITADQLAIALATAAGRTTPATPPTAVGRGTAGPSTAAGSTSRLSTPARPAINADFLQQAIAAASVRSPQINEVSNLCSVAETETRLS